MSTRLAGTGAAGDFCKRTYLLEYSSTTRQAVKVDEPRLAFRVPSLRESPPGSRGSGPRRPRAQRPDPTDEAPGRASRQKTRDGPRYAAMQGQGAASRPSGRPGTSFFIRAVDPGSRQDFRQIPPRARPTPLARTAFPIRHLNLGRAASREVERSRSPSTGSSPGLPPRASGEMQTPAP